MKRKVLVAMSGGVDSSVAAALMKEEGYEVIGVFLKLWKGAAANNESGCCSVDAAEDARRVAQVLDFPFYVFNFADKFNATVVDRFKRAYASGQTPNPCVECNRSVKFSMLSERAKVLGCDFLATGHYARIAEGSRGLGLFKAIDRDKDQSYVLYMLDQEDLAHSRLPVGDHKKAEIREIAASLDLRTALKPESQEICFVPNGDTQAFLSDEVPAGSLPGPLVDTTGHRLGTHKGFAHYTVGQRRGLGVALGHPLYVKETRPSDNTVVVAPAEELATSGMSLVDVSFVGETPDGPLNVDVATRYRGEESPGSVFEKHGGWRVEFDGSHQAAAPGQAAVFYKGDELLGGGTIACSW